MTLHHIPGRTKPLPPLRVGVGGPVGSGKTTLVEMLCKTMRERWDLVVVTNDIYTKEDQRLLFALHAPLAAAVQTAAQCRDDELGSATVGAALASMHHETQYSRLFRS